MKNSKHTAFTEIPVVDVSRLFSSDKTARIEAARDIDRAARDVGFLYIEGHGVSQQSIDALIEVSRNYFSQSLEAKMENYIGFSENHSGYVPRGEEEFSNDSTYPQKDDLKEGYDIGPRSGSLMQRFYPPSDGVWPENDEFKKTVTAYYKQMVSLSRVLFRGFALGLNLDEEHFTNQLNDPPSQLRLLHYFEDPLANESNIGIAAHTDYEFFTILLPTAPGLQVVNGQGDWIDVPVKTNCFVVNIGDMVEKLTNGAYKATSHRVQQVKEERFSFPFFASLDYETLVEPLENFVGEDTRIDASPVSCGDHLFLKTLQTFRYLKKRWAEGEIHLPEKLMESASSNSSK